MILADKIVKLRRQNNLSQEELAEQLGISRQSVSKWENGTSIPDLDKIIRLSNIFGVSTDYLLKDAPEEAAPKAAAPWDVLWLLGLVPLAFGFWGLLRMLPGILAVLDMGAREALWIYFPHLLAYGVLVVAGAVLLLYGYRNQHK